MAKNQNAATPAVAPTSNASTEAKKPEIKKIPRAVAEAMLAAGDITKEMLEKWVASGRVTSGEGGGEDVKKQLVDAGVAQAVVDKFYSALADVNNALWADTKTYKGKMVPHKFSYNDVVVEKPAQLEAAIWVKHFDPTAPKKEKKS